MRSRFARLVACSAVPEVASTTEQSAIYGLKYVMHLGMEVDDMCSACPSKPSWNVYMRILLSVYCSVAVQLKISIESESSRKKASSFQATCRLLFPTPAKRQT